MLRPRRLQVWARKAETPGARQGQEGREQEARSPEEIGSG